MSWVSDNKFITGFSVAMLFGAGALGYFAFDSKSSLEAAMSAYSEKRATLDSLENAPLYPKLENQKAADQESKRVITLIHHLQNSLAETKVPAADFTAQTFQQELKRVTDLAIAKAKSQNISLSKDQPPGEPVKFDMGFDYLSQLPEAAAAAPLARQLKVIDSIISMLMDHKVTSIGTISRAPLPQEKPGAKIENPTANKNTQPKNKPAQSAPSTEGHMFKINFIAPQNVMAASLNSIVGSKEQLLIIRRIQITNTSPLAPQLNAQTASVTPNVDPAQPVQPPVPSPAETEANKALTFILGEERVEVELDIEMLDVSKAANPSPQTDGTK